MNSKVFGYKKSSGKNNCVPTYYNIDELRIDSKVAYALMI